MVESAIDHDYLNSLKHAANHDFARNDGQFQIAYLLGQRTIIARQILKDPTNLDEKRWFSEINKQLIKYLAIYTTDE